MSAKTSRVDMKDMLNQRGDVRMVDQLIRVGMRDAAHRQLRSLKWAGFEQEDQFKAIAELSDALGDYRPSANIRSAGFASLRNLPASWWGIARHQVDNEAHWKIYFPRAHAEILSEVSAPLNINPFLLLSVMRAESYYNREARSPVGAQGLMQIMPFTAMKIATLLHDEAFDIRDMSKPEMNIGYGAYYLDKLLRYYGDNPFLAVAAYNAGPVAVNHWRDACKSCEADEFADAIPYRETRRYVREVMRNFSHYMRIYTGQPALTGMPEMPLELPDGEEIF